VSDEIEVGGGAETEGSTLRSARDEFEKEFILQKLKEYDWNVSRTADAIEIERSNLHRKMKAFGIEPKKSAG
jgi:two-component system nitrogen regulation response regulator NtrX